VRPGAAEGDELRRLRARLRLLSVVFLLAFASVGMRLVDLERRYGGEERAAGSGLEEQRGPTGAWRRDLRDRNGRLVATSVPGLALAVDPSRLPDRRQAARALARVLSGVEEAELRKRFRAGKRFAWVKRRLSPAEQRAVQELGLPGLLFLPAARRVYPQRSLLAHLLGGVDVDGRGLAGVEFALDRTLTDPRSEEALRLAVDVRVQQLLREELLAAYRRFRAKGACGLVLDVRSGELLALASLPDFDPNRFAEATPEQRRNRCTGSVYELGSLFKVITAAAALGSGRVDLADRFDATQPLRIGRNRIDDDHAKRRWLSVPEILAFSSNIGIVQMSFAAGAEVQRRYLERLGLRDPLRVELAAREQPLWPREWKDIVLATVAFGHGIAVTPLHFARAVAALVGDGRLRRATLVKGGGGVLRDLELPPQLIRDLRFLLWLTVERGTGQRARVPGYLVGGKTGTADKPLPGGRGYRSGEVVSSFVGLFPIEDPRYLVLVLLDEPQGTEATFGFRYGGWTAAPAVGRVIARAGPLLGVPPSTPRARRALLARLQVYPVVNGRTGRREEGFAALRPGG